MALTKQEIQNLTLFLNNVRSTVSNMARETKYPELRTIYNRIHNNLNVVPIKFVEGNIISSDGRSVTMGQNIKQYVDGTLKSQIQIPRNHFFDSNGKIRVDGALTLLHEQSHVILPKSASHFTANIGLHHRHADEFFADVFSARIAKRAGINTRDITNHLYKRRSYFGFPIDRFVFSGIKGLEREIKEGRFKPLPRKLREVPREPLFRRRAGAPKIGIPGLGKKLPGWMPGLRKRPMVKRPL